jgi:plastocyanin
MNKTVLITLIAIVVVIGGGLIYWYATMSPSYSAPAAYETPTSTGEYVAATSTPVATSTPAPILSVTVSSSVSVGAAEAVAITNFAFSPATLTVHKGTTVTWTNNDSAPHMVTGDNGGPSSSPLSKGKSYSYTFNAVGSFPYHCSIHPYMKATVQVIN